MSLNGYITPSSVYLRKRILNSLITSVETISWIIKIKQLSDFLSLPSLQTADDTGNQSKTELSRVFLQIYHMP